MHGQLAFHGKPVVHETKNTLFHFSSVVTSKNQTNLFVGIKDNGRFRVESVLLPLVVRLRTDVEFRKVGFKVLQLGRVGRSNKHCCERNRVVFC